MAKKPTRDELRQLTDAIAWKLDEGDVAGANLLGKTIQLVTKDEPQVHGGQQPGTSDNQRH